MDNKDESEPAPPIGCEVEGVKTAWDGEAFNITGPDVDLVVKSAVLLGRLMVENLQRDHGLSMAEISEVTRGAFKMRLHVVGFMPLECMLDESGKLVPMNAPKKARIYEAQIEGMRVAWDGEGFSIYGGDREAAEKLGARLKQEWMNEAAKVAPGAGGRGRGQVH